MRLIPTLTLSLALTLTLIPSPDLELGHGLKALRHRAHVVGVALAKRRAALVALEEGLAGLRARLRPGLGSGLGLGRPGQA